MDLVRPPRLPRPRKAPTAPTELRDRIGQMVMVGFRGLTTSEAEPTVRAIEAGAVGAVVL